MTILVINGKMTMPSKHTIIGCRIVGAEQVGDTITKLILDEPFSFPCSKTTIDSQEKEKD